MPPRRLNANVLGVIWLGAPVGVTGVALASSSSDMAATLDSTGEWSWAYRASRARCLALRDSRWEEEGKRENVARPSWAAKTMLGEGLSVGCLCNFRTIGFLLLGGVNSFIQYHDRTSESCLGLLAVANEALVAGDGTGLCDIPGGTRLRSPWVCHIRAGLIDY